MLPLVFRFILFCIPNVVSALEMHYKQSTPNVPMFSFALRFLFFFIALHSSSPPLIFLSLFFLFLSLRKQTRGEIKQERKRTTRGDFNNNNNKSRKVTGKNVACFYLSFELRFIDFFFAFPPSLIRPVYFSPFEKRKLLYSIWESCVISTDGVGWGGRGSFITNTCDNG